jgi:hypothetical protein
MHSFQAAHKIGEDEMSPELNFELEDLNTSSGNVPSRLDPVRGSFSWKRVLAGVSLIVLVLFPAILVVELTDTFIGEQACCVGRNVTLAQTGDHRAAPSFDVANSLVPREKIFAGGPPKDGIPALTEPRMVAAEEAIYLSGRDRVIGVMQGEESRAYPLKILNYHEIINDRLGSVPIAITYCPLCDSAAVFDRRFDNKEREFGVSGLLYNSNVLMYDRSPGVESLWSQLMGKGIAGPAAQKSLITLPLELTSWTEWKAKHPQSLVLSNETGHQRDYDRDPYAGYFQRADLMFPAEPVSDRLRVKERVLGVWVEDTFRAYPESAFNRRKTRIEDDFGGKRLVLEFAPGPRSIRIIEADKGVEWMYSLWFAWYAMHPETTIYVK